MLKKFIRDLSILKKFLFINLLIFSIIGLITIFYLNTIQPNLINKKTSNHIQIINNTIDHLNRLEIKFNENDIRKFLFSTRFLFQSIDRVIIFDNKNKIIGDTNTLDLDPRSFIQSLEVIEMNVLNEDLNIKKEEQKVNKNKNSKLFTEIIKNYKNSSDFGKPFTFTQDNYNQFLLTTIKSVTSGKKTIGFLAITENANDIKTAINERKNFIIRTAIFVAIVILIFSFVLNRYFLKPIRNLVNFTELVKNKKKKNTNIDVGQYQNDEIGLILQKIFLQI